MICPVDLYLQILGYAEKITEMRTSLFLSSVTDKEKMKITLTPVRCRRSR
jgi:hypothetical protein